MMAQQVAHGRCAGCGLWGDRPTVTMGWWQAGVLAALILALAWGAAVLRGKGRNAAFLALAALAGALTWVTVGLMLGGIAPGRTELMLPASSGIVPAANETLRTERRIYGLLEQRHPEVAPKIAEIERLRSTGDGAALRQARMALLESYLPLYAPRSSDAAIREYAEVGTENLEMLFLSDALLCRETAVRRYGGVSDALNERATAAAIAVLNSAMSTPQAPPDATAAIALRRQVVDHVYENSGTGLLERPLLARPALAPPDLYCLTLIRIFKGIFAMPPADGSMVLRFHFGQEVPRG